MYTLIRLKLIKFLNIIKDESKINSAGFYDLNELTEKNKIKALPKKEIIKNKIKKSGCLASGTHFKGEGIRSNIPYSKLVSLIKN